MSKGLVLVMFLYLGIAYYIGKNIKSKKGGIIFYIIILAIAPFLWKYVLQLDIL